MADSTEVQYTVLGCLAALITSIVAGGRWVLKRLFDEQKGIITIYLRDQAETAKKNSETQQENVLVNREIGSTLKYIKEWGPILKDVHEMSKLNKKRHENEDSVFSTKHTNHALKVFARTVTVLIEAVGDDKLKSEIRKHASEIDDILSGYAKKHPEP